MKIQANKNSSGHSALARWLRRVAQDRGLAGHRYERRKVREILRHPETAARQGLD